jgi:hypothetical protein
MEGGMGLAGWDGLFWSSPLEKRVIYLVANLGVALENKATSEMAVNSRRKGWLRNM